MRHVQHTPIRSAGVLAASALLLGLVACGERVDSTGNAGMPAEPAVSQRADTPPATPAPSAAPAAEMQADAQGAATSAGQRIDDATITASVNATLARDPDLSALRINVDTKSGVVTLDGTAPSADAKDRATKLAQSVDGVNGVNNNLQVEAS